MPVQSKDIIKLGSYLMDQIEALDNGLSMLKNEVMAMREEMMKESPEDRRIEKIASRLASKTSISMMEMMPNNTQLRKLIIPLIPSPERVDYDKIMHEVMKKMPMPEMPDMQPMHDKMDAMMEMMHEEMEEMKKEMAEVKKKKKTELGWGGFFSAGRSPIHETFTMNGSDTTVTLQEAIAAQGNAVIVRYNGQTLDMTTHYTVDGKQISLTFTPENNNIISCTYWP